MIDAIERYLASTEGDEAAREDDTEPGSTDAATFARCDAVLALTPRLAESADLAWAFDEARDLARFRDRSGPAQRARWYRDAWPAWSLAATLALALLLTSAPWRSSEAPGPVDSATPTANITFAPIVVSAELAATLAEVQPVALLADQTLVDSRSLAVLPFTGRLGTAAVDNSGLSAASIYGQVLGQLATVPGLYLVDPATATAYSDSGLPAEQIAQQLGVRGIVQGSIELVENGIRFELSFTDAAASENMINESIERPTQDLALLQTDITSSVLDALAQQPPPLPDATFSR